MMTYDDWKATPPCDNCGMTGCHLPGCEPADDDFDADGHVKPDARDEEEAELCAVCGENPAETRCNATDGPDDDECGAEMCGDRRCVKEHRRKCHAEAMWAGRAFQPEETNKTMSFNMYLCKPACSACGREEDDLVAIGGQTYNVNAMFSKALGREDMGAPAAVLFGGEPALLHMHGKRAGDFVEVLRMAVQHMREYPEQYKPMEPSNGWGSYAGALEYMQRLHDACVEHPDARIRFSG